MVEPVGAIKQRQQVVAGDADDARLGVPPAKGPQCGRRHGQIAHPDPYTATMQVIEDERVDEVIVSTFPGERSGWLRRDVVERLRKDAGVPVEHVVASVATEVTS